MENSVYIVECKDYRDIANQTETVINLMGGIKRFAKNGEKIVLKPNLLRNAAPDTAVCTHPSLVAAVGGLVKAQGAEPMIADSPGGGYRYIKKTLNSIYDTSGMHAAARQAGIELNWDTSSRPVSYPAGTLIKHFDIITPVIEADAIINLCKMKTHVFTGMTGAVKNIFGVVPGLSKPGYHAKLQEVQRFAGMLLDLIQCVSPRLSIMDAVVAMEGDGPGAGDPKPIGLLMASTNPLALDVVANEIMGLDRLKNPVLLEAERRGLNPCRLEDVDVIGENVADLKMADFKPPQISAGKFGYDHMPWYLRLIEPMFKNAFTARPRVIWHRCIACGTCIEGCPVGAVSWIKERAYIDDGKCIRCYCCHEMCPEEAIGLFSSWLNQLIRPT